jgi:hypothetical protein
MFYFVHNADKEVIIPPQEFKGGFIGTRAQLVLQSKCEDVVQYMKDNKIKLGFAITPDCKEQYEHFFELEERTVTEEREDVTFDEDGKEVVEIVKEEVKQGEYIVVNYK